MEKDFKIYGIDKGEKMNNNIPTIKCPKCNSGNVGTYRMPTGAIWCIDCGYRVEHKEIDRSFFTEYDKEKK